MTPEKTNINYPIGDLRYIERPNHLVIGSAHFHRVSQSQLPSFIAKLSKLEGMKIEGQPLPLDVPYDCAEVLAKASMAGKTFEYIAHKRPNGDPLGTVLKEYGVPIELTEAFYGLFPLQLGEMKPIRNADDMTKTVLSGIYGVKERFPDLDVDRAVHTHIRTTQSLFNGKINLQDIDRFINTYYIYHGLVIEYEFMQPDILDFRQRIKGKIGFLVGDFHTERITDILDGNLIMQPPHWSLYRSVLDEASSLSNTNIMDSVKKIEQIVLAQKD